MTDKSNKDKLTNEQLDQVSGGIALGEVNPEHYGELKAYLENLESVNGGPLTEEQEGYYTTLYYDPDH